MQCNSNKDSRKGRVVYIKSFGCQMNVRDAEVIAGLLKANDYQLTADLNEAEIVLFNTCAVRQHAEEKVWSEIGRMAKSRKASGHKPIIGLIGCMAQEYKEQAFQRSGAIDFVVGPSDIDKIPRVLEELCAKRYTLSAKTLFEKKIWETDGAARPDAIYHSGFYQDNQHAYVVISEGCSNFCSFCVVPYVRGPIRNRSHEDILREIKEALDQGISKFTLLGQNVSAYHYEEVNFSKLLKLANAIKGVKEFSFVTSHPKDTTIELFEAMQECAHLKKSLHLPVQSGSDRILKLMNRGYSRKFYLDLVDSYRKIVKGGLVSTDIIVGFPTEGKQDFADSRALVGQLSFDSAYIFKYSPRPRTEAAKLADDVSKPEKELRHKIILELQKEISRKSPRNS